MFVSCSRFVLTAIYLIYTLFVKCSTIRVRFLFSFRRVSFKCLLALSRVSMFCVYNLNKHTKSNRTKKESHGKKVKLERRRWKLTNPTIPRAFVCRAVHSFISGSRLILARCWCFDALKLLTNCPFKRNIRAAIRFFFISRFRLVSFISSSRNFDAVWMRMKLASACLLLLPFMFCLFMFVAVSICSTFFHSISEIKIHSLIFSHIRRHGAVSDFCYFLVPDCIVRS